MEVCFFFNSGRFSSIPAFGYQQCFHFLKQSFKSHSTPPNATFYPRNETSLRDDSLPSLNKALLRPYILNGVALGSPLGPGRSLSVESHVDVDFCKDPIGSIGRTVYLHENQLNLQVNIPYIEPMGGGG